MYVPTATLEDFIDVPDIQSLLHSIEIPYNGCNEADIPHHLITDYPEYPE